MQNFKIHITSNGEEILYTGSPDLQLLENLSLGAGDIWHSSFKQGYFNFFEEIIYFAATFNFLSHDFPNLKQCVSWRINPEAFAVRKSVWERLDNWDIDFKTEEMRAINFGFNAVKNQGAVSLYVENLFTEVSTKLPKVNVFDMFLFYRKNFKKRHSVYLLIRKGLFNFNYWNAYLKTKKIKQITGQLKALNIKDLQPVKGSPTIGYVIPTMLRQNFTRELIICLKNQTVPPTKVVVVDATPLENRQEKIYEIDNLPFELIVQFQTTKGSCRARNEALELLDTDYVIFGDDDICIPDNFVENHILFLQNYNADACNGLDIRADHEKQTLNDLWPKLKEIENIRWKSGVSFNYSNANSCVSRAVLNVLKDNDVNFDGGYGEDTDFGLRILKNGFVLLHNPFSANLHLKPAQGGYRFWGNQAKKRKAMPWEGDFPVKNIFPIPSPTISYYNLKHYDKKALKEYKIKHFLLYLGSGSISDRVLKFITLPKKFMQYEKSIFYAKKLIERNNL
ncbi:glycosyltransferase family 2 protein [Flavobacterium urocaniciphilum]|uniref:Glycosyltransferase, GT2 family n=1 Tax=Flavobacterium urocaniciphilum TaxID=1299341 RepID=A0A1H8YRT9_9FLAO|nr:glycosyltransferase [Flavobacterium urocaniciphilum]SEP54934.1 Glycosyltransferase, GT2 family [Flavobacterium urocaniciphilum]